MNTARKTGNAALNTAASQGAENAAWIATVTRDRHAGEISAKVQDLMDIHVKLIMTVGRGIAVVYLERKSAEIAV